jgi:hypothetical protein
MDVSPNKWLERTAEAVTRRLQGEAAGGAPPCAAAQPHRWADRSCHSADVVVVDTVMVAGRPVTGLRSGGGRCCCGSADGGQGCPERQLAVR